MLRVVPKCKKQKNTQYVYTIRFLYFCEALPRESNHYLITSYKKCFQTLALTSLDYTPLYLRSKHLSTLSSSLHPP